MRGANLYDSTAVNRQTVTVNLQNVIIPGLEGDDEEDEAERAKQEKLAQEAEAAAEAAEAAAKETAAAESAAADGDEDMLDVDESEFDADDLDKLAEQREVGTGIRIPWTKPAIWCCLSHLLWLQPSW